MSFASTTALAFSMSADAFAAAVSKGSTLYKPQFKDALKTGAIFGIVETITPLIGWCAGLAASSLITSVDHWIAFVILSGIGLKMLYESLDTTEDKTAAPKSNLSTMIITAIGTSIDAMAVGVTLAFLNVNIVIAALSIGLATFLMATTGILFGHFLGRKMGKLAEALGGIGLILIGASILYEHLGVFG